MAEKLFSEFAPVSTEQREEVITKDMKRSTGAGNQWLVRQDFDARSKVAETAAQAQAAGYPARWPNVVCAHRDTIQSVDAKWPTLGLGALLPSPSLKYGALVRSEGAEAINH
jgi:hypothetical protein